MVYTKTKMGLDLNKNPELTVITYTDNTANTEVTRAVFTVEKDGLYVKDTPNDATAKYKLDFKGLKNEITAAYKDDIGSKTYTDLEDKLSGATEDIIDMINNIDSVFKYVGQVEDYLTLDKIKTANYSNNDYFTVTLKTPL